MCEKIIINIQEPYDSIEFELFYRYLRFVNWGNGVSVTLGTWLNRILKKFSYRKKID